MAARGLDERFGTNFTEADQLFFDQIRASAENNENIAEAASTIYHGPTYSHGVNHVHVKYVSKTC